MGVRRRNPDATPTWWVFGRNMVEKAQVEDLVTNGNQVTTYRNLWKWQLELDGIMVLYVQITSYVQSAYNT